MRILYRIFMISSFSPNTKKPFIPTKVGTNGLIRGATLSAKKLASLVPCVKTWNLVNERLIAKN